MKDINKLRFADDIAEENKEDFLHNEHSLRQQRVHLLSTSLKVTQNITPKIDDMIQKILSVLNIENVKIECYIYNSTEMNASCFSLSDDIQMIIMLSSELVNKMKPDELSFVIGHEIGHYIFGHLLYRENKTNKSEFDDMTSSSISQARELSADRIGLICSSSIESSLRAIIKTVSGLDDKFITYNLHSYLHQIESLQYDDHSYSTHPIFPIRAKALTLFSMSELYYWWNDDKKTAPLSEEALTLKIRKDLESTTLKSLKNESKVIVEKFKLWFYVKSFMEDNKLDKEEQSFLEKQFGTMKSQKAMSFSKSNPNGVNKKYEEFRHKVQRLPRQYKVSLITEMSDRLGDILKGHNVQKYFVNLEKSILDS